MTAWGLRFSNLLRNTSSYEKREIITIISLCTRPLSSSYVALRGRPPPALVWVSEVGEDPSPSTLASAAPRAPGRKNGREEKRSAD
jgi:hypothetical protein